MSNVVFLLFVALISLNLCQAKLVFKSITPCEVPKHDLQKGFSLDIQFKPDAMAADVKLATPFELDDTIGFEVSTEKMEAGKWQPDDFSLQGSLCDSVSMYMPEVAKILSQALKVEELCPLKAGKYHVENFGIAESDAHLPDIPTGLHYMLKFVYKKDETPIACYKYEIETV